MCSLFHTSSRNVFDLERPTKAAMMMPMMRAPAMIPGPHRVPAPESSKEFSVVVGAEALVAAAVDEEDAATDGEDPTARASLADPVSPTANLNFVE